MVMKRYLGVVVVLTMMLSIVYGCASPSDNEA